MCATKLSSRPHDLRHFKRFPFATECVKCGIEFVYSAVDGFFERIEDSQCSPLAVLF